MSTIANTFNIKGQNLNATLKDTSNLMYFRGSACLVSFKGLALTSSILRTTIIHIKLHMLHMLNVCIPEREDGREINTVRLVTMSATPPLQ